MKKPAWKRYLDFWGRDLKREVEEEFEFHLEMRARELIDRGLAPEESKRQAVEYFGHRESLKKECTVIQHRWDQQSRLQGAFNEMLRDFLFALRQFRTRRSTSLTVVLTLGLGIGINTAVFSLVQNVLLSPLPYPHAEELIRVWDRNVEMDLLYLVRGVAREREFALRAALGAGRFTLIRQLLMEALVVSLAGAFVGASVGWLGQRVLVSFLPADLPRRNEAVFNWEVALFGFFLALCCGLMVGWFQARFASRAIRPALNSRQGGGLSRRMTRVLVAAEVAVSLALLVGGALLTQSFVRLGRVDPGFATASVSRASMTSLASGPEQGPERIRLMASFWQELTQVGGVEAAALVHRLPLDGNSAVSLRPRESTWDDREPMWVNYRAVSPGYFDVLGISFLEGRDFEFEEAWQEPRGIVLNRALSEFFWPGQEGVGKRLGMSAEGPWFEVLGVVADVHEEDLSSPPQPAAYIPYVMAPVPAMEILVRGPRSSADLSRETSAVLGRLAPFQAVTPFQPMDEFMQSLRAQPRAGGVLLSTFALLATLLALLGVVGLVSATVAGRMHELGVRLVLGATPGGVTRMTFRDGLLSAAAGVPLGLFLAWLGSRWLSAYVFEVSATDPVTYLAVTALLLLGAGLAAYLPARRAARIDPRQVLDTQG